MNSRGQFFSQDLVIAIGVFIFALVVFFSASNSIFSQTSLFDGQKSIDEVMHSVTNTLVLSPGLPANWENTGIDSAFALGLASANNDIAPAKAASFVSLLNDPTSYGKVKEKLGLGPFDLHFRLFDSLGNTIVLNGASLDGGEVAAAPKMKLSSSRAVMFEGSPAVMETVFSLGK